MEQQENKWTEVDQYLTDLLIPTDPVLEQTLQENDKAGLPKIDVSPNQGKFLHLLARIRGARRILEIGTLGGYSTTWLARALPRDGKLISLELEPKHAEVAKSNLERAELSDQVEIRVGEALSSLAQLKKEDQEPFDLIFIDADKPNNPNYLAWALQLSSPGSVIICDNVIRDGEITNSGSEDPSVQGVQRFFELVATEPRLTATAIQTVGSKGYDGFAVLLVTDEQGN